MPMHQVTLNAKGAHLLDEDLSSLRKDAGSYVEATRIIDAPIAAIVIASRKVKRNDINSLHVSLAHSHTDTLRETARQMSVKVFGEIISF